MSSAIDVCLNTEDVEMKEWSPSKKWNPFNSYKLLAHVYRWRLIQRGMPVPQPSLVTVDPVNLCNLDCVWCNSSRILEQRNRMIQSNVLSNIAEGLSLWQGNPGWPGGVEAVCIAGGGEPLLHPDIGDFIEECIDRGIEVGIVTNGVNIDKHIEQLSKCTWVGVSVDAGSADTFNELKGKNLFERIIYNIKMLSQYSSDAECRLGSEGSGYGISYKYLLYNGNIHDICSAAETAKSLGCKNFHLRPAGIPWHQLNEKNSGIFSSEISKMLSEQIERARLLEDDAFGIYGITHKFDDGLNAANYFNKCHAIFMTAVFMPPKNDDELFSLGTCCDRRGDSLMEVQDNITDFRQVEEFWGSEKHWSIFDQIDPEKCPRCTYQPHNQIYEHVIEKDNMTYKFI